MELVNLKVVFIGDAAVGKTCLIYRLYFGFFPERFICTLREPFSHIIQFDGKQAQLNMWEAPPQDDYDRLRPLYYPCTDVFVLCFAVDRSESLQKIREKWIPELLYFCTEPEIPFLLVGCKADLVSIPTRVSVEQVEAIRESIGATEYVECSAKNNTNMKELAEAVVRAALAPPAVRTERPRKCVIL